MDESLQRNLIVAEVQALVNEIMKLNPGITGLNILNGSLHESMTIQDLIALRTDLQRTLRAIGGVMSR